MGEELDRLKAMIEPDQETWDLTVNDVRAIRWAIRQIEAARPSVPPTADPRLLAAAKAADGGERTAPALGPATAGGVDTEVCKLALKYITSTAFERTTGKAPHRDTVVASLNAAINPSPEWGESRRAPGPATTAMVEWAKEVLAWHDARPGRDWREDPGGLARLAAFVAELEPAKAEGTPS